MLLLKNVQSKKLQNVPRAWSTMNVGLLAQPHVIIRMTLTFVLFNVRKVGLKNPRDLISLIKRHTQKLFCVRFSTTINSVEWVNHEI